MGIAACVEAAVIALGAIPATPFVVRHPGILLDVTSAEKKKAAHAREAPADARRAPALWRAGVVGRVRRLGAGVVVVAMGARGGDASGVVDVAVAERVRFAVLPWCRLPADTQGYDAQRF